jgi:hypothetical protein
MRPIIGSQARSFGATMKGRTGGLESEGSPEGFGLPLRNGAPAFPALLQSALPIRCGNRATLTAIRRASSMTALNLRLGLDKSAMR